MSFLFISFQYHIANERVFEQVSGMVLKTSDNYDIISRSEMISYHFTGIIFIDGFITLIYPHIICNKTK